MFMRVRVESSARHFSFPWRVMRSLARHLTSPKVFSPALAYPCNQQHQKTRHKDTSQFGMRYLTAWGKALYPALYPILGIYFFIVHPPFWSLFKARLIPLFFLSLLVYTLLFMFTLLPQAAFLAIIHTPAALVSAVFLVLGEGVYTCSWPSIL